MMEIYAIYKIQYDYEDELLKDCIFLNEQKAKGIAGELQNQPKIIQYNERNKSSPIKYIVDTLNVE